MHLHHGPGAAGGFTLTELSCCLAVFALLAMLSLPPFLRWLDQRRLGGAANELAADLRLARDEAVNRGENVRIGFRAAGTSAATASTCYVLYVGAAGACRCTDQGQSSCTDDGRAIRAVALPPSGRVALEANVSAMNFDPLHGTSTPAATLRLSAPNGVAIHHIVNLLGRVRSCSPAGAAAGYPSC